MKEKAEQGIYPWYAPFGYENCRTDDKEVCSRNVDCRWTGFKGKCPEMYVGEEEHERRFERALELVSIKKNVVELVCACRGCEGV